MSSVFDQFKIYESSIPKENIDNSRLNTEQLIEPENYKLPLLTNSIQFLSIIGEQTKQINKSIAQFDEEFKQIDQQLLALEDSIQNQIKPQKKKNRRKANQINKTYSCTQCMKGYGSEISLNLHIKIKHNQFYQTLSQQHQISS